MKAIKISMVLVQRSSQVRSTQTSHLRAMPTKRGSALWRDKKWGHKHSAPMEKEKLDNSICFLLLHEVEPAQRRWIEKKNGNGRNEMMFPVKPDFQFRHLPDIHRRRELFSGLQSEKKSILGGLFTNESPFLVHANIVFFNLCSAEPKCYAGKP